MKLNKRYIWQNLTALRVSLNHLALYHVSLKVRETFIAELSTNFSVHNNELNPYSNTLYLTLRNLKCN